jgi:hypothetical protein
MTLPRTRFLRILAALALLLFAGDISADSLTDMMGAHCAPHSESVPDHGDKSPCSHCSCATHSGAVVIADFALRFGAEIAPAARLRGEESSNPTRLASSIEHPPQLA